jgi:FtsH-binding integral membrane protein
MHKLYKILLLGLAAGILNAIPMAFLSSAWQPVAATLLHWLALSIVIAYARMPLESWATGMLLAVLTSLPMGILLHPDSAGGVLQVLGIALVLGGLLGLTAERLVQNQP